MNNNDFDFLIACLDEQTINYLSRGLDGDKSNPKILNIKDCIEMVSNLLSVESLNNSPFNETLLKVLKPYLETFIRKHNKLQIKCFKKRSNKIKIWEEGDNTEIQSTINKVFDIFLAFLRSSKPSLSYLVLSLDNFSYFSPYFVLCMEVNYYPDWLLFPARKKISPYLNEFRELWRKFVHYYFKDSELANGFKRIIFLVSFLAVLKSEYEKLNTEVELKEILPIKLPDNGKSSKFIEEKIFCGNPNSYSFYAGIILGVYSSLENKSPMLDLVYAQQISGHIYGNNKKIESIKPEAFTTWQAKLLIQTKAVNPLFALMSSLRYNNGVKEASYYAQLYYEFQKYEVKDDRLKKLLIDHFFPYNHLNSNYVIKSVGMDIVDEQFSSSDYLKIEYVPPIEEGINLELIDRIYLYLNNLSPKLLTRLIPTEGVDVIQVENLDNFVVARYSDILSAKGYWSIVKNQFECEVEERVTSIFHKLRHNINHYLGPLQMSLDAIESFVSDQVETKKQQRALKYTRESIGNLDNVIKELSTTSKRISDENKAEKANFIFTLSSIIANLRKSGKSSEVDGKEVSVLLENVNVPEDFKFIFWGEKAAWFATMIENIIHNAYVHGFSAMDDGFLLPDNPRIVLRTEIFSQTLSLKIMNNGRKSKVKTDEYKTEGLSQSLERSSHKGLGGAQIDEIARRHGGVIYLSSAAEWNFILNIDFKM